MSLAMAETVLTPLGPRDSWRTVARTAARVLWTSLRGRPVRHGELPWWRPAWWTILLAVSQPWLLAVDLLFFLGWGWPGGPPVRDGRVVTAHIVVGAILVTMTISVVWVTEIVVPWLVKVLKVWLYVVADAWQWRTTAGRSGALTLTALPVSRAEEVFPLVHGYLCHWWGSEEAVFLNLVSHTGFAPSRQTRCVWRYDCQVVERLERWLEEQGRPRIDRLACEFCSEGRIPIRLLKGDGPVVPERGGIIVVVQDGGQVRVPLLVRAARALAEIVGDVPLAVGAGLGFTSYLLLSIYAIRGFDRAAFAALVQNEPFAYVLSVYCRVYASAWASLAFEWVPWALACLWGGRKMHYCLAVGGPLSCDERRGAWPRTYPFTGPD